jgi:hypothetical protein
MSRRTAVALFAVLVLVAGAAVTAWVLSQQGGPVNGDAATTDEFVDSLPKEWNCIADVQPVGATVYAQCPGIGRYVWYVSASEAETSDFIDLDGGAEACAVLSGRTVASNMVGFDPETGKFDTGDPEKLVDSFAGKTETFGVTCPE